MIPKERNQNHTLYFNLAVTLISFLPFCLLLMGVEFGNKKPEARFDITGTLTSDSQIDLLYSQFSGAFTHTILEWSAFMTAFLTAILAFAHFKIKQDIATPVVGTAFFCSGCMDAFHTLAADRLIHAVADNENLIPFTWAISRVFNALIMMVGVGIFLIKRKQTIKSNFLVVVTASAGFGYFSYLIIHYCATSPELPKTMFPGRRITRPWDIAPLILFMVNGWIFFLFHEKERRLLSYALILSCLPQVMLESHMAFGSQELNDAHFNIAHFLKIIAYLVPFLGLCLDYVHTYQEEQMAKTALNDNRKSMESIVENVGAGIITFGETLTVKSYNSSAEKIFGYTAVEMIGQSALKIIPEDDLVNEKLSISLNKFLDREIGQEKGRVEILGIRRSGERFPMEFSLNRYQNEKDYCYVGIMNDITERKAIENQILKAKESAEAANIAKSAFLANMSHGIRTPLNAVLGYTQILLRDASLKEKHREFIQSISHSGNYLLTLINDILDISKIEAGRMEIQIATFNLEKFLSELHSIFNGRCENEGLEWKVVSKNIKPGFVEGDPAKLRSVLVNLLGNAVKFTDEGYVSLAVSAEDNHNYRFVVEDSGPGLPLEAQKRIFEPFQQDAEGLKKGGTGLGLAISSRQLDLMGGKLEVESLPGRGAKFFFTLRLSTVESVSELESIQKYKSVKRLSAGTKVNALVVDDDADNLAIIVDLLKDIGVDVSSACNGREAIARIINQKPDIVFMDDRMPMMTGKEALIEIRDTLYVKKDLPVIFVSASALAHEQELFYRAGANGFISKPVLTEEVFSSLAQHLNVEFEYHQADPHGNPEEKCLLEGLKISSDIISRINLAAEIFNVTELTSIIEELKTQGSNGQALASALQTPVKNYDMRLVRELLGAISSD